MVTLSDTIWEMNVAQKTANVKVLRWERVWHVGGAEGRSLWQEQSKRGERGGGEVSRCQT